MNKKPVLFASFRPLQRAENLRAIYEAYPGEKVHICTFDPNYRQEVLSGKYDLMVIDEFPTVTPCKCIMIWHGIQGGKYIGLDQPGHPFYKPEDKDLMTCIVSAGIGAIPMWVRCTGMSVFSIKPYGMPRTDQYIGKQKGDGHTPLAEKRSYLFVPTFRDRGETPFPDIDWDYIDNHLTDDELIAVKVHPWSSYQGRDQATGALNASSRKHIITIPGTEPSTPYLYDADVIVTDYSSIMFDGYLLGKPAVLFEKNPGYTESRGMYLQYPEQYCSRYATDEQGLIALMRDAYGNGLTPTEISCRDKVAEACDGNSCKRISRLIDSLNRKGW